MPEVRRAGAPAAAGGRQVKGAQPWSWPLLCVVMFLGAATGLLWLAGASPVAAADGAFGALAGVRPQTFAFSDTGIHAGWVALLYGAGLVVRIFLIAWWAAYLVRSASERNELSKLRRALAVRMRPETAELPTTTRSVHWN